MFTLTLHIYLQEWEKSGATVDAQCDDGDTRKCSVCLFAASYVVLNEEIRNVLLRDNGQLKKGHAKLTAWVVNFTPGTHWMREQRVCVAEPLAFHFGAHVNRLEQPHSPHRLLRCVI